MGVKLKKSILKVKNSNGDFTDIDAIQGKSAYQYAVDGGYTGTEEQFKTDVLGLPGGGTVGQCVIKTETGSEWGNYDWENLQNKPFYETVENITILPETTIDNYVRQIDTNIYMYNIISDIRFEIGKSYTVIYDGVEYNDLICVYNNNAYFIGAQSLDLLGSENPFIIGTHDEDNTMVVFIYSDITTHTIKIIQNKSNVTTIDKKFLPEAYVGIRAPLKRALIKYVDGEPDPYLYADNQRTIKLSKEECFEIFTEYNGYISDGNNIYTPIATNLSYGQQGNNIEYAMVYAYVFVGGMLKEFTFFSSEMESGTVV